jgi:hypothetical protein
MKFYLATLKHLSFLQSIIKLSSKINLEQTHHQEHKPILQTLRVWPAMEVKENSNYLRKEASCNSYVPIKLSKDENGEGLKIL